MVNMIGLKGKVWMSLLLNDLASWTYLYNIILGVYAFIVFLYWALERRGASAWYIYIMALLLSGAITSFLNLYARYLLLSDLPNYKDLITSCYWAGRSWISSITVTVIAIHASWRLFKCSKLFNKDK